MTLICPVNALGCKRPGQIVRTGRYYRTSDRRWVQRYRCAHCGRNFSQATFNPAFGQKKRQWNFQIHRLLVSGVSQRRIARLLPISRKTVARKLSYLGLRARHLNLLDRKTAAPALEVQFDDLETLEHTKLKPLSVTLMVEKDTRRILGFEVSRMPAKGALARISRKKYGRRKDERPQGRDRLFRRLHAHIHPLAVIESDQNPHYRPDVKRHFPEAVHVAQKGARGAVTGQGELKKLEYDPLYSLNHTCAMLRANINRLFRRTWCTTKKLQPLIDHLELYVLYHNQVLLKEPQS